MGALAMPSTAISRLLHTPFRRSSSSFPIQPLFRPLAFPRRPTSAMQAFVTGVSPLAVRAPGARAACLGAAPRTAFVSRAARRAPAAAPLRAPLRHVAPRAQKQMDTEWNSVKVLEASVIAEDQHYLVVDVGTTASVGSLCDAYRQPGMYVQIRPRDGVKAGFFALSCAPNVQGVFEFLIKDVEATAWVKGMKAGDTVEMSPVMGKGFGISEGLFECQDVLCFATGTGIAPIRAAIESRLNGINPAKRKSVTLYYGQRYPRRMAYKDRFKLWESDNVQVVPVMSQGDKAQDEWSGRTGYIQDAFKEDGIKNPETTGVLLCGHPDMCEAVKIQCVAAGVKESRILTNF